MNQDSPTRRSFLGDSTRIAGGAAIISAIPSVANGNLNSDTTTRKKRVIFIFTPNGMVKKGFWPQTEGENFEITPILKPLEKYRDRMLVLNGICNHVRGDGDNHMRGMGCFLTGIELFPGNVQGGGHTPAGWAKGISIDQEIRNYLQSRPETRTKFGSLEFGICVRNTANPWTRWSYAGPNQPIAPVSDPYQMRKKMYGEMKDQKYVRQVIELLQTDFDKAGNQTSGKDRILLDTHRKHARQMREGFAQKKRSLAVPPPQLPTGVAVDRNNMPKLTRMQIDLMVNGFENDLNRVATLQFTESVGQPVMKWLGIKEGHHKLSHDPDLNRDSQEKLVKINQWYAEQIAYLVKRLDATRQPGTDRSLLDDTLIVWGNELGHGNSHTLNNIPLVLLGGGESFGIKMGRYRKFRKISHNRLWLTIAHGMGHKIKTFGNPKFCKAGPLPPEQVEASSGAFKKVYCATPVSGFCLNM